jgi:hypothetical protein
VVFAPVGAAKALHEALARAGAGEIGRYDRCAFMTRGEGLFRPRAGSRPKVGRRGRLERVPETRLEMIADEKNVAAVVAALRAAHPYEEPAFDLYPLRAGTGGGYGCIGSVAPSPLAVFARRAARALGAEARVSGKIPPRVRTVAVCPGSGGRLVEAASRAGADVFVTGEVRYNVMREAEHAGIAVVELGHDRTEMPAVGLLARIIREGLGRGAAASLPIGVYKEPRAARTLGARRREKG